MGVLTMEGLVTMKLLEHWGSLLLRLGMAVMAITFTTGCETPSPHTISWNYGLREDLPIDPPGLPPKAEDDCVNGGRLYKLYCGSCHNARPLGERAFSNYHVAVAHMRSQAYLTGKEHRQIIMFLRRWHDIGPPTPPVEPSPKRFVFSQPISELRRESPDGDSVVPPPQGQSPFQRPPTATEGASDKLPEALPSPIEGVSAKPAS
jgi:hypothetical protein